ncbi:hypothetical protein PR048_010588 [Dryococelus australis]|uniref:Uncharacterized protein n=1 Tax=Dryococelus australis TaxID=614101 RepID=A0ABQ9I343_9NEOP|nr:hypothetical protein PR048_010588 [Dryococelus australis]
MAAPASQMAASKADRPLPLSCETASLARRSTIQRNASSSHVRTETLHALRVGAMRRQARVLVSPVWLPRFLTLDAQLQFWSASSREIFSPRIAGSVGCFSSSSLAVETDKDSAAKGSWPPDNNVNEIIRRPLIIKREAAGRRGSALITRSLTPACRQGGVVAGKSSAGVCRWYQRARARSPALTDPDTSLRCACNRVVQTKTKGCSRQISFDRLMNKVMTAMTMLVLHKAEEYTTCIQVDLNQGFQKCCTHSGHVIGTSNYEWGREKLNVLRPLTRERRGTHYTRAVTGAGIKGGGAGKMGDPRGNPSTNGIVRHDSHLRKSGVARPGIEPGSPRWEVSRLTARQPWPHQTTQRDMIDCKSLYTIKDIRLGQNQLGPPLVDDRPIMNAVKYTVVSGVVWTKRTMTALEKNGRTQPRAASAEMACSAENLHACEKPKGCCYLLSGGDNAVGFSRRALQALRYWYQVYLLLSPVCTGQGAIKEKIDGSKPHGQKKNTALPPSEMMHQAHVYTISNECVTSLGGAMLPSRPSRPTIPGFEPYARSPTKERAV